MLNSFGDISSIANDLGIFQETDLRDIDRRLMILEEENKQLRNQGHLKSELERLKLELNYANSLKHKYRNMYNEVAVKLMYLQNTDSMIFEEDDQIISLNKKVEMLVAANEDLKKKYDEVYKLLAEERLENEQLKETAIPQLIQQIEKLKGNCFVKERTNSLCVQKNHGTFVEGVVSPTPRKAPVVKSSPFKSKPKSRDTVSSAQDDPTISRKVSSVGKNSFKGYYMPSFMRNKKSVRKET